MESIFDRLRNHAKYVEKTIAIISNELTNETCEITEDEIKALVDLSFEDDLDQLLAAVLQENDVLESLKTETENSIHSMMKQLDCNEQVFKDCSVSNASEIESNETNDYSIELKSNVNEEIPENISVEDIDTKDPLNSTYGHLYRYLEELKLNEITSENV